MKTLYAGNMTARFYVDNDNNCYIAIDAIDNEKHEDTYIVKCPNRDFGNYYYKKFQDNKFCIKWRKLILELRAWEALTKNLHWVCKMTYGRFVGTHDELKCYRKDSENLRDVDLCAKQPTEELQAFCDGMYEYDKANNAYITVPEYWCMTH